MDPILYYDVTLQNGALSFPYTASWVTTLPTAEGVQVVVLQDTVGQYNPGLYLGINNAWYLAIPYVDVCLGIVAGAQLTILINLPSSEDFAAARSNVSVFRAGQEFPGTVVGTDPVVWGVSVALNDDAVVYTVNHIAPDSTGNVEVEIADIPGLAEELSTFIAAVESTSAPGGTTLVAADGTITQVAQIKELVAGANVNFSQDGSSVTINATNDTSGGGTLFGVQSTGTGTSLVNYDGTGMVPIALIKSLQAGTNVTITPDAENQTLTITAANLVAPVTSVNGLTGAVVLNNTNIEGFATVAYTGNYSDLNGIPTPYSLPAATTSTLGGIIVGNNLTITPDGTLSATATPLFPATTSTLGGVIVGSGLNVAGDGTISINQSQVVTSINGQTNAVTLAAGTGISVVTSPGTITISSAGGSVTSVGLAMPSIFSVSGSPVTGSGTLTATLNTQNANTFLGGPSSGGAATPVFRTLTVADILLGSGGVTSQGNTWSGLNNFTGGSITVPTLPASDDSNNAASTAYVQEVVATLATGVTSFNTRTGAVVFQAQDITGVGGALLASPAFTGSPTAPTQATASNNTQIATTAFVQNNLAGYAPLASPAFTGTPTAPTATPGTNTTQLATTAFVQAALGGSGVTSFNGRTGAVTLTNTDISAAGGALLSNPVFTGSPMAPTAAFGTSSAVLATTAFVQAAVAGVTIQPATTSTLGGVIVGAGLTVQTNGLLSANVTSVNGQTGDVTGLAPLASPAFTGTPTAPTPNTGDDSTNIATTAFVQDAIAGGLANTISVYEYPNLPAGSATFNISFTSSSIVEVFHNGGLLLTEDYSTSGGTGPVVLNTPTEDDGDEVKIIVTQSYGVANTVPATGGAFSGLVSGITASPGDNSQILATTAFVDNAISSVVGVTSFNSRTGAVTLQGSDISGAGGALLASPVFTGTPQAPTQSPGDNTTNIATTAFVTAAVAAGGGGVTSFNTRTGAVTLQVSDVSGVGGAIVSATNTFTGANSFTGGSINVTTQAPGNNTTLAASTAFVTAAVAGSGVTSFNTRTGAVTLQASDVSGVGGAITSATNTWTGANSFTGGSINVTTQTAGNSSTLAASTAFVATSFAPLASPTFTGVPAAPTASPGTNTTQLATTAFVTAAVASSGVTSFNSRTGAVTLQASDVTGVGGAIVTATNTWTGANSFTGGSINVTTQTAGNSSTLAASTAFVATSFAPLASPTFTGTPAAPTASPGTNTTQIATTAFVEAAVSAGAVTSFNSRTGAVTLQASDVSGVGGAIVTATNTWTGANSFTGGSINVTTQTSGNNTTLAASTAFVTTAVSGLAPLASPAFTGTPTVPTPGSLITTTQAVNAAYVSTYYAPLASPTFTGTPAAPTASPGTNTTQLATTAFVTAAVSGSGVTSFNTRTGAVTLTAGDVTGVGGAIVTATNTWTGANSFTGGSITVPTQTAGNSSTNAASTAFVATSFAPLASPALTGTPTAPTATGGTNTTQIATTALVVAATQGQTAITITNANVTLTAAQASTPTIVLTGTISANVTLTFPSAGQWMVVNDTTYSTATSPFYVTLSNGSGATIRLPSSDVAANPASLEIVSDGSVGIIPATSYSQANAYVFSGLSPASSATQTLDLAAASEYAFTVTANTTIAFTNAPASGFGQVAIVRMTNGGAFTIGWPSGTTFAGGSAPTYTTSGTDLLGVLYDATAAAYTVVVIALNVH